MCSTSKYIKQAAVATLLLKSFQVCKKPKFNTSLSPPKMTGILQPVDVGLAKPIKQAVRLHCHRRIVTITMPYLYKLQGQSKEKGPKGSNGIL
jgi:hypothetical protein